MKSKGAEATVGSLSATRGSVLASYNLVAQSQYAYGLQLYARTLGIVLVLLVTKYGLEW